MRSRKRSLTGRSRPRRARSFSYAARPRGSTSYAASPGASAVSRYAPTNAATTSAPRNGRRATATRSIALPYSDCCGGPQHRGREQAGTYAGQSSGDGHVHSWRREEDRGQFAVEDTLQLVHQTSPFPLIGRGELRTEQPVDL